MTWPWNKFTAVEWLDQQEGVPQDLEPKKMKLKRGDIHLRTRGN